MNQTSLPWYFLNRTVAVCILLVSVIVGSCEKEPGPVFENSCIKGYVVLNDAVYGNLPAVKITASGPYGSISTSSDNMGQFWFFNVGNGTYEMECSLEGYGSVKKYGIQVFGNDTVTANFEPMNVLPDQNKRLPELLEATAKNDELIIKTNSPGPDYETAVRLFFGNDSKVSDKNFFNSAIVSLNESGEYHIPLYFYDELESGKTYYVTAYICNLSDQGYMDMVNNIMVFPTVNPDSKSEVLSFVN